MQNDTTTFKVFKLDEYEWWAGPSLQACLTEARRICGADCYLDDSDWFGPLSDEALQTFILDPEDCDSQRTMAEELAETIDAPGFDGRPFLIAAVE